MGSLYAIAAGILAIGVLTLLDRWGQSPNMRRWINAGTDRYVKRQRHLGQSVPAELIPPPALDATSWVYGAPPVDGHDHGHHGHVDLGHGHADSTGFDTGGGFDGGHGHH